MKFATLSLLLASLASIAATASAAPIIQPGAPGEPSRELSPEEAIEIADTSYSRDDVRFMQDMIPHHHQALLMAALVADRTNNPDILDLGGRIEASQGDEIAFMQGWLRDRDEDVPDPTAHDAMHTHHDMAGMASPEEMAELAEAEGTDFDQLFLELMIPHHEGAVTMVEALHEQPGSAYEPLLFEFTNDIVNDQVAEIERMNVLLVRLSDDPRAGLAAGFDDAGQAAHNMRLVVSLPKPAGFYDPANPAGLSPKRLEAVRRSEEADARGEEVEDAGEGDEEAASAATPVGNEASVAAGSEGHHADRAPAEAAGTAAPATAEETIGAEAGADPSAGEETAGADSGEAPAAEGAADAGEAADSEEAEDADDDTRSPLLDFANTDIAFADDVMVVGNYHGFNVYRLTDDPTPEHVSSVVCPGGQGDVSIVGDLLIMSAQETRGRLDCGLQGVSEDVSAERFRGLRIFDISDLARPVQVGAVQTCRGSHTHSVVSGPGEDGVIVVYNSGTSSIREEKELPGCYDATPGDTRTALFRIDVIEIPVDDPASARIVDSPAVFADPETGSLAGLWRGGDHGDEGTQETRPTDECHDITVFPAKDIAAGACSGNGIVFDISDPRSPERIDVAVDEGFAYWHSATFDNTGDKVLFTDEWGGGSRPRCRAHDPLDWGANAIYDLVDGELVYRSHFKIPAPQVEEENCVAHNGSILPVPGRDIFVQAWYQGGISVIDFTDSANPAEIAFFDRGPIDEEELIVAGYWSAYWYDGRVYGTEIARGLDVLELVPSEHLSAAEIAAASVADYGGRFNPQQQFPVAWPAEPVVARAYLDQLDRHGELTPDIAEDLGAALDRAEARLEEGAQDAELAARLEALAETLTREQEGNNHRSGRGLARTLADLAERLRA